MEDIEMSSQGPTQSGPVEDANLCIHCRNLLDHVHETTDTGCIFPHHQHIFALAGSVRKGCQLCSLFVSHDKDTREKWVNLVLEDGVLEPNLHWYSGRVSSFSFNSIGFGDNEGCWSLTFEFHCERLWASETINQVQDFIDTTTTPPSDDLPCQHETDKFCSKTSEKNQGWKEIDDHWWPLYSLEKSSQYTWTLGNGVDLIPTMDSSGIKGTHSKSALPPLQCVKQWLNTCVKSHTDCKPAFNNFVPPRLIYLHDEGPRLCLSKDMHFCPPYATLSYTDSRANYSKRTNLTAATLPQFLEKIPPEALCRTFEDAITITKHVGIHYLWIDTICVLQQDGNDRKVQLFLAGRLYGNSTLNIAATGASRGDDGCFIERPHTTTLSLQTFGPDSTELNYMCVPAFMYRHLLDRMPLMDKAFSLQARLLSPRTIHCTPTEIFWECHGLIACETFPLHFPGSLAYTEEFLLKRPITKSTWPWIIRQYTKRILSYSSDRPFEIYGIVEKIQSGTEDVYMAGLWRAEIEKQLCWKVNLEDELALPGRLPSWSWLSVDGSIEPRLAVATAASVFYIDVVGVDMKPRLSNAFAMISQGRIDISYTYLVPCKLSDAELRQYSNRERTTGLSVTPDYNMESWHSHDDGLVEELFFLPIFFNDGIEGIIIRLSEEVRLQFRRLGHFKLGEWPNETTSSEPNAVESLLREVGDIWYGGKDGNMDKDALPIIELI